MSGAPQAPPPAAADPAPPFGGRWAVLYALVLAMLALTIAVLAWLTGHFR